jgi:imidazoleglycerol-phosphate dehydratase
MNRTARIERVTGETDITVDLTLDGRGHGHMLTLFARHSLVDLNVQADGDIQVDLHHTVEDTGIALGQAFTRALGEKRGIRRFGSAYVPMDETMVRVVVDISGRPFLAYRAPEGLHPINGTFAFTLVEEFLRAFTNNAGVNLHVEILYGRDAHHMAEAVFKGLAKAVDQAIQLDPRVEGVPSTKGTL